MLRELLAPGNPGPLSRKPESEGMLIFRRDPIENVGWALARLSKKETGY